MIAAGGKVVPLGPEGKLTSWLSPNASKPLLSSTTNEQRPPDMADVVKAIEDPKRAVLFLLFHPGSPSVAHWAANAQRANKDPFVRGGARLGLAEGAGRLDVHLAR